MLHWRLPAKVAPTEPGTPNDFEATNRRLQRSQASGFFQYIFMVYFVLALANYNSLQFIYASILFIYWNIPQTCNIDLNFSRNWIR